MEPCLHFVLCSVAALRHQLLCRVFCAGPADGKWRVQRRDRALHGGWIYPSLQSSEYCHCYWVNTHKQLGTFVFQCVQSCEKVFAPFLVFVFLAYLSHTKSSVQTNFTIPQRLPKEIKNAVLKYQPNLLRHRKNPKLHMWKK